MRQQLEERLAALKAEYDKGQTRSRQLEGELTSLRETMLRISGAILVLQELLSPPAPVTSGDRHQVGGITAEKDPSASTRDDRHIAIDKED